MIYSSKNPVSESYVPDMRLKGFIKIETYYSNQFLTTSAHYVYSPGYIIVLEYVIKLKRSLNSLTLIVQPKGSLTRSERDQPQTRLLISYILKNVVFPPDVPMVVLELGSKLNPNDIEEGDDVYFECDVRANPPAYKVVWEHNVSK